MQSHYFTVRRSVFQIREMQYFKVHQSTIDNILPGHTVIVKSYTPERVNIDGQEYWFVRSNHIILHVSNKINPGPDIVLLKPCEEGSIWSVKKFGCGIGSNGSLCYFTRKESAIKLQGVQYFAVRKDNVAWKE